MPDTYNSLPRGRLWHIMNALGAHRTFQYRVVHYGFWSTLAFVLLMALDMVVPNWFASFYMWVTFIYFVLQWAEAASRNPFNNEVLFGNLLALLPAIMSLVIEIMDWDSGTLLTTTGRYIMKLWCFTAWGTFLLGVWISYSITQAQYRRTESIAPRS